MENLLISETYINLDKGYRFGDSDVYETFTSDRGELYRSLVREFGRCTGKVYIDRENQTPQAIGWVFVKRMQYDDCNETYLREVWVTVHERKPEVKTTHFYAEV
jgi:hypothetical protein